MSEAILEVKNLVKDYRQFRAVDTISFIIPKGRVIGLLGPNGAGKTTIIQMLLGLTKPTSGEINYLGKNFFENRQWCLQRINFTSAYNYLLGRITVAENLKVFAGLYSLKNIDKKISSLAEYFEITELLNIKFQDLSAGQKTRVNLIKSLLNDPELILMDEPTASLDPDIADKTLSLIEKLNKDQGTSILFTSHNMDEITRICEEVIIMDRGKIVAKDTPIGLTKMIKEASLILTFASPKTEVENYLTKNNLGFHFEGKRVVVIQASEKDMPQLIIDIDKSGIEITDIEIEKPSLEDVFIQIARQEIEVK